MQESSKPSVLLSDWGKHEIYESFMYDVKLRIF